MRKRCKLGYCHDRFYFVKGLPVMNWTFISQMPRMGMKKEEFCPIMNFIFDVRNGTHCLPLDFMAIYLTDTPNEVFYIVEFG